MKYTIFFSLCVLTLSCSVNKNEGTSDSKSHLSLIDSVFYEYISTNRLNGGAVLVAHKGEIILHKAYGKALAEGNEDMNTQHIFRIASMTKQITAVAALMLLEEGKYTLEDPLWWYLPEFRSPVILDSIVKSDSSFIGHKAQNEIRIKHLFNHTSGIPYGFDDPELNILFQKFNISEGFEERPITNRENAKRIAQLPIIHEPGSNNTYGLSYDILGTLIEIWSGKNLYEFFSERIFQPLEMNDTHFYLPENKYDRLPDVFMSSHQGVKPAEYTMVNYPVMGAKTYFSGGADISCTIEDYWKFAEMVRNKGRLNGTRLLSESTIDFITTQQLEGGIETLGWGLGLVNKSNQHEHTPPLGSMQWGGFFSTNCLVDPQNELVVLTFLQMYPNWEWNMHLKVENIAYSSLEHR